MLNPSAIPERPRTRKHLSFDPLIDEIRNRAEQLPDARSRQDQFSVADAVMSGFAMFSLKDPSLLAFQERRNDENMKSLYRIGQVPSDPVFHGIEWFTFVELGQLGTAYYFGHFLFLMPLLGKIEPRVPMPTSISESVLKGGGRMPAGAPAEKPMEKA